MSTPSIKTLLALVIAGSLFVGCDRKRSSTRDNVPALPQASETDPQTMEIRPISQLLPDRPTHVAVDSQESIYWVQETPDGTDTLFGEGADSLPQPTDLNSTSIIAAFGPAPTARGRSASTKASPSGGSGNIESIAVDADDNVLFFFSGGIGDSIRVCVGRFSPHDHSITILANTQTLAAASKMGASIELARGKIIRPTKPATASATEPIQFWLWLHHPDAQGFFRFDPRAAEVGRQIALIQAFDHIVINGDPMDTSPEQLEFSAGVDQSLLMVNKQSAILWRVNEAGMATKWTTLLGLPREISAIRMLPSGTALAFAPAGEPAVGIDGDGQTLKDAHFLKVAYPALLAITASDIIPLVPRDAIHAPSTVDSDHLKIAGLVPTRSPKRWLAYDNVSGILMRLDLSPRN